MYYFHDGLLIFWNLIALATEISSKSLSPKNVLNSHTFVIGHASKIKTYIFLRFVLTTCLDTEHLTYFMTSFKEQCCVFGVFFGGWVN